MTSHDEGGYLEFLALHSSFALPVLLWFALDDITSFEITSENSIHMIIVQREAKLVSDL